MSFAASHHVCFWHKADIEAKLLTKDEARRIARISQSCLSCCVEADNGAGSDIRFRG
jgi:hypothetical protein